MKIIAIGDVHGSPLWKNALEGQTFDKVVFVGDYFDSYNQTTFQDQISNFKEILDLKRANMDSVILLVGNHDMHYHKSFDEQYNGYQPDGAFDISEALHQALKEELLQMCFIHNKFLFSHAGLTNIWCRNNQVLVAVEDLQQSVNDLLMFKPKSFQFAAGRNFSHYGDDVTQGPIWVRPNSLRKDFVEGYRYVVGHTKQECVVVEKDIILIDCLVKGQCLVIEDGIVKALTFKID